MLVLPSCSVIFLVMTMVAFWMAPGLHQCPPSRALESIGDIPPLLIAHLDSLLHLDWNPSSWAWTSGLSAHLWLNWRPNEAQERMRKLGSGLESHYGRSWVWTDSWSLKYIVGKNLKKWVNFTKVHLFFPHNWFLSSVIFFYQNSKNTTIKQAHSTLLAYRFYIIPIKNQNCHKKGL